MTNIKKITHSGQLEVNTGVVAGLITGSIIMIICSSLLFTSMIDTIITQSEIIKINNERSMNKVEKLILMENKNDQYYLQEGD